MDFMKKRGSKLLCAAGCALIATAGMGEISTVISQPFATPTATTALGTGDYAAWTGNGTVTNSVTAVYSSATGKPIASATDFNVLSVEGKVTCAAPTTGATAVDMMVQISKPDEELEALTDADVKLAIGVDQTGKIAVYCAPKSGTGNAWRTLPTVYEEGSWHRVTLRFDYDKGVCEVAVDGNPQVSEFGWQTQAKTGDAAGCWYPLAASANGLASVQVVGTTAIDDVVVTQGSNSDVPSPAPGGDVAGIPNSWFVLNGISSTGVNEETPAADGSGMTLKAKYLTGVSPLGGEKFEIKAMSLSGDAGSVKATLTIPATAAVEGYKNVVKYGATPTAMTESQDITPGSTQVVLDVSKAGSGATVIYYTIQTVAQ